MLVKNSAELLIQQALRDITNKYEPNGINPKLYHNAEHTIDVVNSAMQIANLALTRNKISEEDIPLLKLAAAYHDINSDDIHGPAEENSASIVARRMYEVSTFTRDAIDKVKRMILSTTVVVEECRIIQSADNNYTSKILADADLSSFGKPFDIFWDRSVKLYRENTKNPSAVPGTPFIEQEIRILQNHRFFTPESEELFPYKPDNIERLKSLI